MVKTVIWGQVSSNSREPEVWNKFDVEDTADKPEVEEQLQKDGRFTDVQS